MYETDTGSQTSFWQGSQWYLATGMAERSGPLPDVTGSQSEERKKAARKLFEQWKQQAPFNQDTFFVDRLTVDHLSEDDLFALLAESVESLSQRLSAPLEWLAILRKAFSSVSSAQVQSFSDVDGYPGSHEFLEPLYPLILYFVEELQEQILELCARRDCAPFDAQSVLPLLMSNLPNIILPRLGRTFVLEMHVAKLRHQLVGETPEQRFRYYIQWLSEPEHVHALLEEYPVLARQLVVCLQDWKRNQLEMLERLSIDWDLLAEIYAPGEQIGVLVQVQGGAGDSHRQGRSVMKLTFRSGLRLLYKPRSLGVDVHFQQMLRWLNQYEQTLLLRPLKLLDREEYGWSEYVQVAGCQNRDEVKRFYQRVGALLALLYALDATDMHDENIIAAGEYPMLVDLETLFHPQAQQKGTEHAHHPAYRVLTESVLRIGLLPVHLWSDDENEKVDISGLGGQEGQPYHRPVSRWHHIGTDEMRIVKEWVKTDASENRPKLQGKSVNPVDYYADILLGFTQVYRVLMKHSDEVCNQILVQFMHDRIRYIARATQMYTFLLFDSYHPNVLRNGLLRDRCLDRLWFAVKYRPYLVQLIKAEQIDLENGDIPLFHTTPDSCDLFTSRGDRIPDVFAESGYQRVQKRMQKLSEQDLQKQLWLIRASCTSLITSKKVQTPNVLSSAYHEVSKEQLLQMASNIGDRLDQLTFGQPDAASWMSVIQSKNDVWSLQPGGPSLYHGNAGIIFFLAYLGKFTGVARYTDLAKRALKTIQIDLDITKKYDKYDKIGGFSGLGSLIYLFSHLGWLWQDQDMLKQALECASMVFPLIDDDSDYNLCYGAAGCLASLRSLYQLTRSSQVQEIALRCGDHLLHHFQWVNDEVSWGTEGKRLEAGFVKGDMGIIWSLAKLASESGQARFYTPSMRAFEKQLLTSRKEERVRGGLSWARGVAGICLAQLDLLHDDNHYQRRAYITESLHMLLTHGFSFSQNPQDHTLSQGLLGSLETLLTATQVLNDATCKDALHRLTSVLVSSIDVHGFVTGAPLDIDTPNLMTGLAGIGYGLLRLADPQHVPSLLLLSSPCIDK